MRAFRSNGGFTLIELMIVVVIVAILASIAYPSYREYVRRGERTEAKTALMTAAQELERCFTQFNAYDDDRCALIDGSGFQTRTTEGGHYVISAIELSDSAFRLEAARQNPADPNCGNFRLAHNGQRGALGSNATDPNDCWRR